MWRTCRCTGEGWARVWRQLANREDAQRSAEVIAMTIFDVQRVAADYGFTLEQRGASPRVWQWRRGNQWNWPTFGSEEEAVAWMDFKIRTASLFNS
jgi:hypothetical protein